MHGHVKAWLKVSELEQMEEKDVEITLPKIGESIVSATVVAWLKKEGEFVHLDEPLLEVSTDKVNSEIPSPVAGTLKSIHAKVDAEIDVGALIAVITTSAPPEKEEVSSTATKEASPTSESASMKQFFTPGLLRFAKEKGVALDELETISATGAGGRVSKKDVEEYLSKKKAHPIASDSTEGGKCVRLPLSPTRRNIAKNMARSYREIPHATLISEVDMTEIVHKLKKAKQSYIEKNHCKPSITSVIAKALVKAVQTYPLLNSSFEEDAIVLKQYVNLGIAVSVEEGVVVPVIQNCQSKNLLDIAREIADLAEKARTSRLNPQDVQGGTITLTNFGMSDALIGLPIIRFPEVAILGVGAVQKKVALLAEQIVIRSIMTLSLTFDHRVFDGMYGCDFLRKIKRDLEGEVDYFEEE